MIKFISAKWSLNLANIRNIKYLWNILGENKLNEVIWDSVVTVSEIIIFSARSWIRVFRKHYKCYNK